MIRPNSIIRAGAIAGAALALSACVPIPGSTINVCAFCSDSTAWTRVGPERPAPTEGPAALLPGAAPETSTPEASPSEADATVAAIAPPQPEPALPALAPTPAVEPSPAAPGAGAGPGVAPDSDADVSAAPETYPDLAQRIRDAEGFCPTPCEGPTGELHIGYGHRIQPAEADALPNPITPAEGDELLAEDMAIALEDARRVVGEPTWSGLTERRREVLTEMAYMLGEGRLRRFERMLAAVRSGDYREASIQIIVSLLRPPTRVARLSVMMYEG